MRRYLVVLALSVAAPLLAYTVYLVHRDAAHQRGFAELEASTIARSVAVASEDTLDVAREQARRIARRTSAGRDGVPRCDLVMHAYGDLLPRFLSSATLDRHGNVVCNAVNEGDDHHASLGSRDWFRTVMDQTTEVFVQPRVGAITGRWLSAYASPVIDTEGEAVGAVTFAVDLEGFPPIAGARARYGDTIVGIVDREGKVITRSEDAPQWIGQTLPPSVLNALPHDRTHHRTARSIDAGDGFLYAVAPVGTTGWFAYAEVPIGPIVSWERTKAVQLALGTALVLVVASAAAAAVERRITSPIRSLALAAAEAENEVAEVRAPVSGPREAREVATAFNHMLQQRRERDEERSRLAERLRALSERLLDTCERERKSINAELHDAVGQNLAVLNLNLALLEQQAPASLARQIHETRALAQSTVEKVRDVMCSLRPPGLDEYGLCAALRIFCGAFSERAGIPIELECGVALPRLPIAVETAVFRIAQEAVTNAVKHARCGRIAVALRMSGHNLELCVADDGAGFDPSSARIGRSWGVSIMRERADAIGASLEVQSAPGAGTRVTAIVRGT